MGTDGIGHLEGEKPFTFAAVNTTKTTPAPMAQIAVVQEPKLECQSNDDFCTPGCEHADMQCMNEGNDENKNGVKDSEENQGDNDNDNRNHSNTPCFDREATERHADDDDLPNCNSVEYGTRCDGSEDENSWTDEEDGGN